MKRFFVILAAICTLCLLCGCGQERAVSVGGINGRIPSVVGLYAGSEDLWVMYVESDLSEYGIYSYGKEERGTESRPRLSHHPLWHSTTEHFWYLDGKSLQEYDPVTGEVSAHPLDREYAQASAVGTEALILQETYGGAVWLYLPQSGAETQLSAAGVVLPGEYDGCVLLQKDGADGTRLLSCWDYRNDQKLWETDLSVRFADGYQITVCGDQVLLTYKQSGATIWTADIRDGVFTPVMEKRVISVLGTENYLICAGWAAWGAAFYAVYPDGTLTQLGNLEDEYIFQKYDPLRMAVYDGKLYYARVEEGDIGYCDLPAEETEEPVSLPELPVYLPAVSWDTFAEELGTYGGADEFLYDYCVSPGLCNTSGQWMLPVLAIYDQWEEDGGIFYLCGLTLYQYQGLEEQIRTGVVDAAQIRCDDYWDTLCRYRLESPSYTESPLSYGGYLMTEILQRPEKGDDGRHLRIMCSGRPVEEILLARYLGSSSEPVPVQRYLPEIGSDPEALLLRYLEVYYPEVKVVNQDQPLQVR